MTILNAADLQRFEQRLRERREELRVHLRAALVDARREEYAVLAGQVHDTGDDSVSELLFGIDLAGGERELREMRDVETALVRIAGGSYGQCLDCSGDIGLDRLTVYPTAKRCIHCQQRYDVRRTGRTDMSPSL